VAIDERVKSRNAEPVSRGNIYTLRRLGAAQGGGLVVALIGISIYFSFMSVAFLTRANFTVILLQSSILGIVAVPGAMLLVSGALDLSVGSLAGLAAASFGTFNQIFGIPLGWSIVLTLAVGATWGLGNGILVSYFRCSPVIVTLAGYSAAAGVAQLITNENTRYSFGPAFAVLGNGVEFGIPVPVIIFSFVFVVGAYAWYRTPIGRHLIGIGANRDAAMAAGVPVSRLPCIIYVLSGTAAAAGGLILTSQLNAASVQIGLGLELQVLTAILLGGVAFNGGRGSLWGTLAGILFIGVLNNGLTLINVGPYIASICIGGALLLAAVLDVVYRHLENVPAREPLIDTHVDTQEESGHDAPHAISVTAGSSRAWEGG